MNKQTKILGVTATPYYKKQGYKHVADTVIQPITFKAATDAGYLVPVRCFRPENVHLNTKDLEISKSTGEYVSGELEKITEDSGISGTLVNNYKKYVGYNPAIVFAVNINHSKDIAKRFNNAGIPAAHIDASTSDKVLRGETLSERDRILEKLKNGELKVVSNVGVLGRGVDMPFLKAVIMARKLASRALFDQQFGRVTRPYPGKDYGILLDCVGNLIEHETPEFEGLRQVCIDPQYRKSESGIKNLKTCKECWAHIPIRSQQCPVCKSVSKDSVDISNKVIEKEKEKLTHFKPGDSIPIRLEKLLLKAKDQGYNEKWA